MKLTNPSKSSVFAIAIFCALALGACAQTGTRESTGAYVDNSAVTGKVKAAILQDPTLKVMQIHVTTYKNIVQLSGFVDSPQMVERAGKLARDIDGVTSVQNDLIVK
jgi:osmotically-inducible protein OsmY